MTQLVPVGTPVRSTLPAGTRTALTVPADTRLSGAVPADTRVSSATASEASTPLSPSLVLVGASAMPGARRAARRRTERGLVSAEWAMAIIAAVAIVGVVVSIITQGPVKDMLIWVVRKILSVAVTRL